MAIFHLSAKVFGRSAGRCATAAAAYRSKSKILDERSGLIYDYTRRGGVSHAEILAPDNAPSWVFDRAALWNAVEKSEKRIDAQVAREIEIALPHELDEIEQRNLAISFVRQHLVKRGMIADICVHTSSRLGDSRNRHAHIMLTTRTIGPGGFKKKERAWNETALLEELRAQWASACNIALAEKGAVARVDHRTLLRQGSQLLPTIHIGPSATAMERRGEKTEIGNCNREIIVENQRRMAAIRRDLQLLQAELERRRRIIQKKRARLSETWMKFEHAYKEFLIENDAIDRSRSAEPLLESRAPSPPIMQTSEWPTARRVRSEAPPPTLKPPMKIRQKIMIRVRGRTR